MWREMKGCGGIQKDAGMCEHMEEWGVACTEPYIHVAMLSISGRAIYLVSQYSTCQVQISLGYLSDEGASRCFLQQFWCVGRAMNVSVGEIDCLF